jgi:hypothetical protein
MPTYAQVSAIKTVKLDDGESASKLARAGAAPPARPPARRAIVARDVHARHVPTAALRRSAVRALAAQVTRRWGWRRASCARACG